MISTDEDALVCDLAETYHIYDYRKYPIKLIATLACGLRDSSRIKMSLSGQTQPTEALLLAAAVDRLGLLVWSKTKDAQHGTNKPTSVVDILTGAAERKDSNIQTFATAEAFEKARLKALGGAYGN